MFNPTRNEARQFLFDAWRKHGAGELLTPLEHVAARVVALHPEFHGLLADPEQNQDRDYAQGELNPFLHLMMHLSIEEQVSIDQPPGVREAYQRLAGKYGSQHEAQHAMMECMAEMIVHAQRNGTAPDAALYLGCLARQ
jgi:Domain of unknown function (DUF1841)